MLGFVCPTLLAKQQVLFGYFTHVTKMDVEATLAAI